MRRGYAGAAQALPRYEARAGSGGAAGRGRTGWGTGGHLSGGFGAGLTNGWGWPSANIVLQKKIGEAFGHGHLRPCEAGSPGHVLRGRRARPPSLPTRRDKLHLVACTRMPVLSGTIMH